MATRAPNTSEFLAGLLSEAHLNFLVGAGTSSPALPLLGDVERLSAHAAMRDAEDDRRRLVQARLDAHYLREVLAPNVASGEPIEQQVQAYGSFSDAINRILLARRNHLLPKRASIFTTNQDTLIERAFESRGMDLRDGFRGRGTATLRMDDLNTRTFRINSRYEMTAEVPTFSLHKVHGSVNWQHGQPDVIALDASLQRLTAAMAALDACSEHLPPLSSDAEIETLLSEADTIALPEVQGFVEAYDALAIVNPTKEKFGKVVLQQQYYEQLRSLSNELERENSVLFVIGFSFADEHIRRLVVRALNANPTLIAYVFCYDDKSTQDITNHFVDEEVLFGNLTLLRAADLSPELQFFDLPTVTSQLLSAVGLSSATGAQ